MKEKLPEFELIRSSRKTVCVQITREAKVVVRAPRRMKREAIDAFVNKHASWIEEHLRRREEKNERESVGEERENELRALAKIIIPQKVEKFAGIMNVRPISVKITGAKTRFGSCSGKNGLCFSWRVMLYPEKAIDYVVVHELSHIIHHDHSKDFWKTVEKYMPDYKEAEKILKGKD
ncbi:MAG: M48 family metallopeptidase [Clostridia bacterium]|nr:M48 family metallopeptidase [Clostridia bacterium]